MEHTGATSFMSLLIAVFLFSPRVEDAAGSTTSMTDIFLFHIVENSTSSSFQLDFRGFLSFSVFCKYIVPFFTEIGCFIYSFSSAHPAIENSRDQFLYEKVRAGCVSGLITTFLSLSISVSCSCAACCRKMVRVMVTDSKSIANNRGRCPLRNWNLSSSNHSSSIP